MKKLLLLPFILLSLVSCDDEDPQVAGPNQTIVGFTAPEFTQNFASELTTSTLKLPMNLIGYNNEVYPSDVTVQYAITSESTATAGVEYAAPSVYTATIESGSSADYLEIPVFPNTFDPEDPKTLVIEMLSVTTANATIGLNNKKVVVYLQGVCPSNLQGGYSTVTTRISNGTNYTWTSEAIAKTDIFGTEYVTEFVGPYYGAGQTAGSSGNTVNLASSSMAGYKFVEVCGKLKLESQNLASAYSNQVFQAPGQYDLSLVDQDTGVITVYYTITFASGNRAFRSVYTPL